jgi:hypothetical protein
MKTIISNCLIGQKCNLHPKNGAANIFVPKFHHFLHRNLGYLMLLDFFRIIYLSSKRAKRQRDYHDTVVNLMSHRCSNACVVDGKCSKRFPKPFSNNDYVSAESYPKYRRRPPAPNAQEKASNPHLYGETYEFPNRNGIGRIIDNRHIVAHNPYLLKKYKSQ